MNLPRLVITTLLTATAISAFAIASKSVASVESSVMYPSSLSRFRSVSAAEDRPANIVETTRTLTEGQQAALLTLRRSEVAKRVVDKLAETGHKATAEDYRALELMTLARRKSDGFHEITPQGKFQADRLAQALAKALGVHTIVARRSDEWNGASIRCSCGWSAGLKSGRDMAGTLDRQVAEHMRKVESGEPLPPTPAEIFERIVEEAFGA